MSEKKTYLVTDHYYASKARTVAAESPEQAEEVFWQRHGHVSACHQCSREIEIGEVFGTEVYDESGETVLRDMPDEKPAKGEG